MTPPTGSMRSVTDPGGDYGYDEVHRDLPADAGAPADDAAATPSPVQDPGGDYGYDEAHDF